jgi:hypothetical protein
MGDNGDDSGATDTSVSDTQNAANLASAENLTQINLGLDQIPQSQWTQPQMISYLQGLSSTIQSNPNAFNAATLSSANAVAGSNLNNLQLQDPSFSWSDFGTQVENNAVAAGNSVVAVGQAAQSALQSVASTVSNLGTAASNTAAVAQWALPALLVIGVYLIANAKKLSVSKGGASLSR